MKKTLIAVALLGIVAMSVPAHADEEDHWKPGHQHRSLAYEQGTGEVEVKPSKPNPDGKRLPLRDCKWYEGATQSHGWPQLEVGNPGRPECPPEAK